MTRRALRERQAYAMWRLDRAINRGYMTDDDDERARAQSWARAWHSCAYAQLDMLIRMNSLTKGDTKH